MRTSCIVAPGARGSHEQRARSSPGEHPREPPGRTVGTTHADRGKAPSSGAPLLATVQGKAPLEKEAHMSPLREPDAPELTESPTPIDYPTAEGFRESQRRSQWTLIGLAGVALFAVMGLVLALVALGTRSGDTTVAAGDNHAAAPAPAPAADQPAPTLADSKGVKFEKYE